MRKSHNRKDRARIFTANRGRCHLCDGLITVGEAWDIEHVIPYALTQDDSDGNLRPAHKKCHRTKTDVDVTAIAKAVRIAAKHNGCWPKSRTPLKSRGFSASRELTETYKPANTVKAYPQRADEPGEFQ